MQQLHKRFPEEYIKTIIERFCQHLISQQQACEFLGIKRARLQQLAKTFRENPEKKFTHGLIGVRRLNWQPDEEAFLRDELRFIAEEAKTYRNKFNFAVLAQQAEQKFKKKFWRNSIRRLALKEGYYYGTKAETRKVCKRFETDSIGFLFQHDSSHHIWIPSLEKLITLITTEDDHSRLVTGWDLVDQESSFAHIRAREASAREYGPPRAYYVDNHMIFRFTPNRGIWKQSHIKEDEGFVQVKYALMRVGVPLIYTPKHCGQPKGKIEKRFDYFQRRIPYLCERYKIKTIEEAKKIIAKEVRFYNECHIHPETKEIPIVRWQRAILEGRTEMRTLESALNGRNPKDIFCLTHFRKVSLNLRLFSLVFSFEKFTLL